MKNKQKFLVVCADTGKYELAMYKIYLKEKGGLSFLYKMNSDEFAIKFMDDKEYDDVEFCVNQHLLDFDMLEADKRTRLIKYGSRVYDTLNEIKEWFIRSSDRNNPLMKKIEQVINKIELQPKEL